jgi:hypothetical protein
VPQPLILEGTLYYECPALSAAPDPAGAPGPAPGVKPNMNLQTHKNQPNHKAHQQHIGNSLKHVLLHTTPPLLENASCDVRPQHIFLLYVVLLTPVLVYVFINYTVLPLRELTNRLLLLPLLLIS